jgi:hypothetical protein
MSTQRRGETTGAIPANTVFASGCVSLVLLQHPPCKRMTKKIIKVLFGLGLIPFCLGFTWQLAATIITVRFKADAPYYFVAGCLAYLTIHLLFKKPILTYVIGHELTHALFAMLFGGSVKAIQASGRGGRVTISKSNFIITLAPYFFPLYTFFALLLYWAAMISGVHKTTAAILIFLSGATFAFHLILTFLFLQTDQADIKEHGGLFSYPLIYLFNTIFAAFLLYIYLAENMDYLMFLAGGIIKTINMMSHMVARLIAAVAA